MFSNGDQLLALREEILEEKKNRYDVNGNKIEEIVTNLNGTDNCLIVRAKNIGAWMNIWGATVNVTVLTATEFRVLCAHVMMLPPLTSRAN